MNVKMVVTLPVDKIPDEIKRIINSINVKVSNIEDKLNNCLSSQDNVAIVENIDSIRKELSLIDLNLEDCYSVLLGYIKYKNDLKIKDMEAEKSKQGVPNEQLGNE